MAVRTILMLSFSPGTPIWYPPNPIMETFSLVCPSIRYGISPLDSAAPALVGKRDVTVMAKAAVSNSRRVILISVFIARPLFSNYQLLKLILTKWANIGSIYCKCTIADLWYIAYLCFGHRLCVDLFPDPI